MKCTAGELARYLDATLEGDSSVEIHGVSSPENARPSDLIYAEAEKHLARAAESQAQCVLAPVGARLQGKTVIETKDPKLAFAKAARFIIPKAASKGSIHRTAIVSRNARLESLVSVGPYVVIESGAEIGTGTIIEAYCCIGRGAKIGTDARLHPRVTIYPGVRLGNRVEVHAGAVLGGDGFGYVHGDGMHWKFPQVGRLEIGDDVEIGANTTIDRGSLETTQIAKGVKIDNLVQIAHNVEIGEHAIIAAQTGISGSSRVGNHAILGGQVGIADHCTIEESAVVGAQAGVPTGKTIPKGVTVWGTPARPLERFKEQYALFARLPDLVERVRKLEKSDE